MPRKKPTGNPNLDRPDRYLISLRLTYLELQEFRKNMTAWALTNGIAPSRAKMPYLRHLLQDALDWKGRRYTTAADPGEPTAAPVN